MKVIFLDNDGVICLSNNWGSRFKKQRAFFTDDNPREDFASNVPVEVRFDNFDRKAIKVLNEILNETDAEIVVSSDWRFHANLNELGDYYEAQGIVKRPIAVTSKFKDIFPLESTQLRVKAELELQRSMEIQHWLDTNPHITHWVAVDDLDMSIDFLSKHFIDKNNTKTPGLENFVRTPISIEGIKQTGIKGKILSYLK